ncbi:hypothetical protein EON66_01920, partial [archaeon]
HSVNGVGVAVATDDDDDEVVTVSEDGPASSGAGTPTHTIQSMATVRPVPPINKQVTAHAGSKVLPTKKRGPSPGSAASSTLFSMNFLHAATAPATSSVRSATHGARTSGSAEPVVVLLDEDDCDEVESSTTAAGTGAMAAYERSGPGGAVSSPADDASSLLPASASACVYASSSDNTKQLKAGPGTAWSSLLVGPPPLPTCHCGIVSVQRTSGKNSANVGRVFYTCSKPDGKEGADGARCKFFMWQEEWRRLSAAGGHK